MYILFKSVLITYLFISSNELLSYIVIEAREASYRMLNIIFV